MRFNLPLQPQDADAIAFSPSGVHARPAVPLSVKALQEWPRNRFACTGRCSAAHAGCAGGSRGSPQRPNRWLENAAEDDKADAEEPGETERERRGYHPLRVEQRPTITGEDRIPKSADDDTSLRHGDADAAAQELAVDSNPRLLPR
jgi:hypothetical protein